MSDSHERRQHELRRERERIARRWTIIGGVTLFAFFAVLTTSKIIFSAKRSCGRDHFGWDGRRCTFAETWGWLQAGADTAFWIFTLIYAVLLIAVVITVMRNARDP